MSQPQFEPQSYPLARLPELSLPSQSRQLSADYFLKLGNRHYNQYLARNLKRDLDAAIGNYRQALEMNPRLAEACVKLASALWDQGGITLESAIQYCRQALVLDESCSDAYLFLGYFLWRSGQVTEAAGQFRLAIRTAKSPAKGKMALGRILIQQAAAALDHSPWQRVALAAKGLREFSTGCLLLPTDQTAFGILKDALWTDLQIFGLTGLGRCLKQAGMHRQTVSLYGWATQTLPQEPIFFHLLGDLHNEQGNADGAIYFYNRAQELDPDNPALHKKLGRAYSRCGDTANAARSLEKAVQANVADFDTVYTLAQIHTDRNEYIRALYYFKELLREMPENPYLHSNLAYILFKLEDYDGAIQEYELAVSHGEDAIWTATVAQTLGTIYYQVKQDAESAISMLQLAYQLDNTNLEALIMLGDIHTEQGEYETAVRTYRHILTIEPDNADCYNYLGYLLWQLDKNEEAIGAYRRAIELNGENPIAYNNLGVIYLDELCQPQSALSLFEQAFSLKPDYTLARFNVARTLEAMGQTTQAARGYSEALMLNAVNPELSSEEIQERLELLFQV